MNKTILIIGGIILILLVIGVWVYLFLFGTPEKASDIFANFGKGGNGGEIVEPMTPQNTNPTSTDTPAAPKKLRQLTTRPVAGAAFTTDAVRFMERGTGHLYDVPLAGGTEILVTGTTIPKVVDATFSESGSRVALSREENGTHALSVGTITKTNEGNGTLDSINLPQGAKDVAFTTTGEEVRYLQVTSAGSSGHSYNIAKKTDSTLFSLPLRDIEMIWGDDAVYAYTTPSGSTRGYVYKIEGGVPTYVTSGQYGLMGVQWADGIALTYLENNTLTSYQSSQIGQRKQAITMFPEKCIGSLSNTLYMYCAAPVGALNNNYPDSWYKGTVSFADSLWEVDLGFQEAEILSNFTTESGRDIDVEKIGISSDGTKLYLINKNDHSLWLYDLSI